MFIRTGVKCITLCKAFLYNLVAFYAIFTSESLLASVVFNLTSSYFHFFTII